MNLGVIGRQSFHTHNLLDEESFTYRRVGPKRLLIVIPVQTCRVSLRRLVQYVELLRPFPLRQPHIHATYTHVGLSSWTGFLNYSRFRPIVEVQSLADVIMCRLSVCPAQAYCDIKTEAGNKRFS